MEESSERQLRLESKKKTTNKQRKNKDFKTMKQKNRDSHEKSI